MAVDLYRNFLILPLPCTIYHVKLTDRGPSVFGHSFCGCSRWLGFVPVSVSILYQVARFSTVTKTVVLT
jgi:hypothetical protein